ncbi:MAG: glutathione S-transferase, partial [Persicimonas sp.]
MLTVHHLENSRSHRILWLLEELELDYELTCYERDPETMLSPPELRAIHPLGKSPVITDGEHTIAESAAILEYVLDEYGEGRLRPAEGTDEYLSYRYWMHYAEGSAMPPLLLKLVFSKLPERSPWLVRPLVGQISKMVNSTYVDPQLELHMTY